MKQHIVHLLSSRVESNGPKEIYLFKNKTTGNYESISWDAMFADVQKVSKSLLASGYGFESMVGIFSNNCPEWSITDYGVMGTRGIVVPFFSSATKEQLKYIVDETKMKLIFVGNEEQKQKAHWLFDHTNSLETIVYYDDSIQTSDERCLSWQQFLNLADEKDRSPELEKSMADAKPEDIATILYTSGTTGEPKGVMLTHDNFMFCFDLHKERLDINETDVSMAFLPLSHVFERTWSFYMMYASVTNIFLGNPREVINELPIANPTVMCAVPRFFEKTHEGIQKEYNNWPRFKQKIFDWSIKTGHEASNYRSRNEKTPFPLSFKYKLADKLVLKKLRLIFGANMRATPCSGAAIRPELLRFFHATGLFVNYGYGATETTATVACFRTDVYNFDSCGSIMPDIQVKISEKNEILVKGRTVFKGYYNKPEATAKALNDGWYATGDEGSIIDDNMLVMTDRLRDLFKTSVGKFVSPQKIELLLGQNKYIEQIIIFGDNKKYITALIVPSFENLTWQTTRMGIATTKPEELIAKKEIIDFYTNLVDTSQQELASYERVVKFTLLPEAFSVEGKTMTSTLKIRRKIIAEEFKKEIEGMYR